MSYCIILWQDRLLLNNPKVLTETYYGVSRPKLFDDSEAAEQYIRQNLLLYRQRCWIVTLGETSRYEVEE
jgi:hypothetical protein